MVLFPDKFKGGLRVFHRLLELLRVRTQARDELERLETEVVDIVARNKFR
jgi:hypothetical protein